MSISGPESGGLYSVTSVDIDSTGNLFAGVIVAKPDSSTCVVQSSGIVKGILSGLTEGAGLFIQTDSTVGEGAPSRPLSGYRTIHRVASAVSSSDFLIAPGLRVRVTSA